MGGLGGRAWGAVLVARRTDSSTGPIVGATATAAVLGKDPAQRCRPTAAV